jgi:hypothetical protein
VLQNAVFKPALGYFGLSHFHNQASTTLPHSNTPHHHTTPHITPSQMHSSPLIPATSNATILLWWSLLAQPGINY